MNLYEFVGNNGPGSVDLLGLLIAFPIVQKTFAGDKMEDKALPMSSKGFVDQVTKDLEKGLNPEKLECKKLSAKPIYDPGNLLLRYIIQVSDGKDSKNPACKCFNSDRLLPIITSTEKTINIYEADFHGLNSYENQSFTGNLYNFVNVFIDPNIAVNVPSQDANGHRGPDIPLTRAPTVWHEVVGHGGKWFNGFPSAHPLEDTNVYDAKAPEGKCCDDILRIENPYRKQVELPLRYERYFSTQASLDEARGR